MRIRINDFNAAEAALKKTEEWEAFKLLGKLAKEEYPESMLGMYYMGVHYENIGEPKKAIKAYQSGFIMNEIGRLTKDDMLDIATKEGYRHVLAHSWSCWTPVLVNGVFVPCGQCDMCRHRII